MNPLITIITVCYNSEKTIKNTIESVLSQTYTNIEYILIDGNSKDNTLKIIKAYEKKAKEKCILYKWISEADKGIYDAMNKGINMSTGDWINFMNSGDKFFNPFVISSIYFNREYKGVTVIYGDVECDYIEFKKIRKAKKIHKIKRGMVFCHQSSFIKSNVIKEIKYNTKFKLAADYDMFIKLYKQDELFFYVNQIISTIEVGGISDINRFEVLKEYRDINKFSNYFLFYLRNNIKKILPNKLLKLIIRMK